MAMSSPIFVAFSCALISAHLQSAATEQAESSAGQRPSDSSQPSIDLAAASIRNALRQAPGHIIGRIRPEDMEFYRTLIAQENGEGIFREKPMVQSAVLIPCENSIVPKPIVEKGRCQFLGRLAMCTSPSASMPAADQCRSTPEATSLEEEQRMAGI